MPSYLSFLIGVNDKQNSTNNRYAEELTETLKNLDLTEQTYILAEKIPQYKYIGRYLIFQEMDQISLVQKKEMCQMPAITF